MLAFLAVGLVATFGAGRALWDARSGLLAAFFFGTAPFVVYSLLNFQLDLPLAAMVAATLCVLLQTDGFRRRAVVRGARPRAGPRSADEAHVSGVRARAAPVRDRRRLPERRRPPPPPAGRAGPPHHRRDGPAVVRAPPGRHAPAGQPALVQAGRGGRSGRALHLGVAALLPADLPAPVRRAGRRPVRVGIVGAPARSRRARLPLAGDRAGPPDVPAHPEPEPALHAPDPAGGGARRRRRAPGVSRALDAVGAGRVRRRGGAAGVDGRVRGGAPALGRRLQDAALSLVPARHRRLAARPHPRRSGAGQRRQARDRVGRAQLQLPRRVEPPLRGDGARAPVRDDARMERAPVRAST